MTVIAARICRNVRSQPLVAVSPSARCVGLRVITGIKVTNEMNVHAKSVFGTSRAAIIVAYFAVPAETKPMRCLNKKGSNLAKIFDTHSDSQTTSTHKNIQTIRTPYKIRTRFETRQKKHTPSSSLGINAPKMRGTVIIKANGKI